MHNTPIRDADGCWAGNNEPKAKHLVEYLGNTFQPNKGDDFEE